MTFCPVSASVHEHGNAKDRKQEFRDAVAEKLADWQTDSEMVGYFLTDYDGDSAEVVIALLRGDKDAFTSAFAHHYEDKAQAAVLADEKLARDWT